VFDNNISGTVPSAYTSLNWLAAAYNPSLYGTWPYFNSTTYVTPNAWLSGSGYGNSAPFAAPGGTGCGYGTSLGLDAPLSAILQSAAAALDPSGALLPSWRAGLQPCPPYTSQNSSSPVYGKSWAGVSCRDGTSTFSCSGSTMMGGASALTLTGLGLNGTLPVSLWQLRSLTSLDLDSNMLTSSIPASWCVADAVRASSRARWLI
jgi:hypothetical protein